MTVNERRFYVMGWLRMGPGSNFPSPIEAAFVELADKSDDEFFADSRFKLLLSPVVFDSGTVNVSYE